MRTAILALVLAASLLMHPAGGAAQGPILIGEINSYSGIAAGFTQPYRQAVEMAVDEVNAGGGLLGRKVEVRFRDDKGNPAEAL